MSISRQRAATIVTLLDARERLDDVRRELAKGGADRVMAIHIGCPSDGGMTIDADLDVDCETGNLIYAHVERIITERLKELGALENVS